MTAKYIYVLTFCILQTYSLVQGSDTCEQKAGKAVNIHKCCTFAPIAKLDTLKAVVDEIVKVAEPTSMKFHCEIFGYLNRICSNRRPILFASKLFETLNLKEFDKAAYKTYMPTTVQDKEWLALYENTTNYCIDELPRFEKLYSTLYKFPKEECDVRYLAFLDCVMGAAFLSCPAKSYTDSPECKETKNFLSECQADEKALSVYIQKQLQLPS